MRKKILIITNRFVIGGPAFHVADLACRLQNDFDIRIIGGEAGVGEEINLQIFSGLENEPILLPCFGKSINPVKDIKSFLKIRAFIREFKPDIVHTHTSKPGLLGRIAAITAKVPIIIHTYHGHLFSGYFRLLFNKILIRTERFLAKKTTAIIALSESQAIDFYDKYKIAPKEKIRIVLPGIDSLRIKSKPKSRVKFRTKYNISEDVLVLGIVGRLVKIKNLQLFIKGVKYLKNNGIKIKGVIAGDGPEKRNLKDFCIQNGLTFAEFSVGNQDEDILFLSWTKEISKIYAGFDGVALTSINEGTPYSIMEAQMSGLGVIASNIGGVSDIVLENKTALLFETETKFYSQLMKWATDDSLRKSMNNDALDWSKDKFTANRMAEETKNLYLEYLQNIKNP